MTDDPLTELLIDASAVDRVAIVTALRDYVGVDTTTGEVVSKEGLTTLTARQKVVAVLLGAKARFLLDKGEEGLTPADVADSSGVLSGTVRPTLRDLVHERLVSQHGDGKYFIAHYQVAGAIRALSNDPTPRSKPSDIRRPKSKKGPVAKGDNHAEHSSPAKKPAHQNARVKAADVRALLESGFFDQPRTVHELQIDLKRRQGFNAQRTRLSTILLRLLRAGVLKRDENDEGQYVYIKA